MSQCLHMEEMIVMGCLTEYSPAIPAPVSQEIEILSLSYIIRISMTEMHAVCIILIKICTIIYIIY